MKKVTWLLIKNREKIRLVLLIAYSFFIIYYAVLSRTKGVEHRSDLRLMWAYREMLIGHPEWKEDVRYNVLNILFFLPFGLLFPKVNKQIAVLESKSWLLILLAGMLFSVFIEITQYITCRGLCELDDVLCNGFGSLIGFWVFLLLRKLWTSTRNSGKELDK